METTKSSMTSQNLSMARMELIIGNIQKQMASETFKRVKLRFLSTNVDRDIREEHDAENETYFVTKHKHIFDRVFIGCSVSHLFTASLMQCLKPQKAMIYMETPLFLLHMSNEILHKFKEYVKDEKGVSRFFLLHMY